MSSEANHKAMLIADSKRRTSNKPIFPLCFFTCLYAQTPYNQTMVNPLEFLTDIARHHGADAVEVMQLTSTDLSVAMRMGKQEKLERAEHRAVGLRVFTGKQQAMISTDARDEPSLKMLAEKAVAMAKASPADPYAGQADETLFAKEIPSLDICDTIEPEVAQLTQRCLDAEEAARAIPGVTNSEGAEAGYSHLKVELLIAPPSGAPFRGQYDMTNYHSSIAVLAGSGMEMEEDYAFSSARYFADLQDAIPLGREAGERAVKRLNPRKMPTKSVPVVWDRRVSKSLLSNFLSAINGSAVARQTSFLKDKMHTKIFADGIRITDDAHLKRGLGSKPFDGEGVRNGKTTLVENGLLQSWLLDIRSAHQLKLRTTGHASRSMSAPPAPAPTNAYIHAGKASAEELIGHVKDGLYLTDLFGMGVNLVTGDFSQGARGFWIENGKVTYPVSEITVAGKLQQMFMQMTAANDLEFKYTTNAPTLLIEGMTVAGS